MDERASGRERKRQIYLRSEREKRKTARERGGAGVCATIKRRGIRLRQEYQPHLLARSVHPGGAREKAAERESESGACARIDGRASLPGAQDRDAQSRVARTVSSVQFRSDIRATRVTFASTLLLPVDHPCAREIVTERSALIERRRRTDRHACLSRGARASWRTIWRTTDSRPETRCVEAVTPWASPEYRGYRVRGRRVDCPVSDTRVDRRG